MILRFIFHIVWVCTEVSTPKIDITGDDEIEEYKVLKLCMGCTTVEINVVLQAIKKTLH